MGYLTINFTKVIGHASLTINLESGQYKDSEFNVFEGKRDFEKIIVGRRFDEAQEIISRISANSSISYSIAALKATENAFGIEVSDNINMYRELLSSLEKVRSHANHLYLMSLPDYFSEESVISALLKHNKEIARGVSIINMSNELIKSFAGREIHPINMILGGISKYPDNKQKEEIIQKLKIAKEDAIKTIEMFSKFEYPSFKRVAECVSLSKIDSYPYMGLQAKNSNGSQFDINEYKLNISQIEDKEKNSKVALLKNKEFRVGVLSRMNMNNDYLMPEANRQVKKLKLLFPALNPFEVNKLRAIEMLHYIERSLEIVTKHEFKKEPTPIITPKAGHGICAVEAPEGIIWLELDYNDSGYVTKANMISPTNQNLKNMEETIKAYLPQIIGLTKKKLNLEVQKLVRSYNPDFCEATH